MFEGIQVRYRMVKKLYPFWKKDGILWGILFCLKLLMLVPGIISPLVVEMFINKVLCCKNISNFFPIVIIYIALYFFETMLIIVHRNLDNYLFNKISFDIKCELWNIYLEMPTDLLCSFSKNDLKQRVDLDVDLLKYFIILQIFDYICYWSSTLIIVPILIYKNIYIALISLISITVLFSLINSCNKKLYRKSEQYRKRKDCNNDWMQHDLSQWKEIKIKTYEDIETNIFSKKNHLCNNLVASLKETATKINIISSINKDLINNIIIYVIGAVLFYHQKITVGALIAVISFYAKISDNIRKIIETNIELENNLPSINRVLEIIEYKKTISNNLIMNEVTNVQWNIKNISFQYESNLNFVIENFSCMIFEGEKISIRGESGCGKSTLVKLLIKGIQPQVGEVLFYNQNIKKIAEKQIFEKINYVPQDNCLINGSIRENLLLANPNATDKDMEDVCSKSCILKDINKMELGFYTKIGDNGTKLSGGQKQLLTIAKVLLNKKDILILDESLSQVDGKVRQVVWRNLLEEFTNKTIICITHEKNINKEFDKHIVFEKNEAGYVCVIEENERYVHRN